MSVNQIIEHTWACCGLTPTMQNTERNQRKFVSKEPEPRQIQLPHLRSPLEMLKSRLPLMEVHDMSELALVRCRIRREHRRSQRAWVPHKSQQALALCRKRQALRKSPRAWVSRRSQLVLVQCRTRQVLRGSPRAWAPYK